MQTIRECSWYKDAIFYEAHVRAFADSGNPDGIGDFRGLAGKLDYLQNLGITALWILPFYPSPLKDDGYDISDYMNVHPDYGNLSDFNFFLKKAHQRGLKVITELVLNHTSDAHAWFQRARRSPSGSVWRDFYVWSDTSNKYSDARIIFKDFETSNWTWDPVAHAYYWHRFYSHQPDLNYDNPEVQKTMFRVLDFWLEMGVDGLRLDAVPYLFEREGTSCENLPETHEFLRKLRRHVDEKYSDRMLLAEANQWPEDAASYFGNGDECHMAFHFPIMPRLFMSIDMEDRFPIIDILQQTPAIPEASQWALFLRNHDELTLEMVTHEERDYMYRVYAFDPKARINLGIRRRLAPLLQNHRRKIELMNGLLFSLPGTPIIYYGDEIGMGDNIYLGDRNGVRTPMQWSADKNAGFSRANPQQLYLPIIIDPEYHYEAFNVEGQQNNLRSLLWWMKRLIALRKRYKAFGRGTIEFLQPVNRKVLVFVRRYENELILVIANLSRFVEYVELDLKAFKGMVPMELFSRSKFPTIGELPYFITLGPHEFYMFILLEEKPASLQVMSTSNEAQKPIARIEAEDRWAWAYQTRVKEALEDTLPDYFLTCRWFGGKGKKISLAKVVDTISVPFKDSYAYMTIVRFEYTDAPAEQYLIPIAYADGERAQALIQNSRQAVITTVSIKANGKEEEGILYDALLEVSFAEALLSHIVRRRRMKGSQGQINFIPTKALNKLYEPADEQNYQPVLMKADQSNTSIKYDEHLMLKIFRRLDQGMSPELEIGNFLTQKTTFAHVPPLAGYLEYSKGQAVTMTLGILQGFVINQGDAWQYSLDEIGRFFEFMMEDKNRAKDMANADFAAEAIGTYLESIRLLGQRTAELHLALASVTQDPDFAPVSFTLQEQRYMYQSMYSNIGEIFRTFIKNFKNIPESSQPKAQQLLSLESKIQEFLKVLLKKRFTSARIRCHGDYHLGQVLCTGKDFVFIDFEGEPTRSLNTRRLKQSPLKDVAGMLRSFHYAIRMGLHKFLSRENPPAEVAHWAKFWYHWVSVTFIKSYLETTKDNPSFAKDGEEFETLLNIFVLEKSIYELNYELNNRPDWVDIPMDGILEIMEAKNEPNIETIHPITSFDLHLLGEGNHFKSYEKLGARVMEFQAVAGVYFSVWAPNARSVSVVGNFNNWQQDSHPMERIDTSGVWELFVAGLKEGEIYKYAILAQDNSWHLKADPYAFQAELRPQTASIVCSLNKYSWKDDEWMKGRLQRRFADIPISIYEVHLGSWKKNADGGFFNYRHLAQEIVAYVRSMGYTHIELLPVMEHPLDESWGYQIINYYAPTSRLGKPEDFMCFIDTFHQNGIGVILDWVPGHFPRDEHGLANFDGQQIYAYPNWKKGEHKEWGTLVFDYGRREVTNFLISNANFWFEKYHVDGLRVDAVASMLYLDYDRRPGEWEPNMFGGHENLEAIDFIKKLNTVVHADHPGILMIAEESTSWPHVCKPVNYGGMGFDMKWNMGWMHDTLDYFSKDPIYRKYHQGQLTFSLVYAFSENFILPVSHDEVIYGKKSLLSKMPGDNWQKFANTRLFLTYMYAHPGKKLSFMTNDIGQWMEWDAHGQLDWSNLQDEMHQRLNLFTKDLQFLYRKYPPFYNQDFNFHGFEWIDFSDVDQSVISFLRWSNGYKEMLIFTFNMTSVPRHFYRVGVPCPGFYQEILNSDAREYGGSGIGNFGGVHTEDVGCHGRPCSLKLHLPPLAANILYFKRRIEMDHEWPSIVIENVSPCIDNGSFAVKYCVGEKFLVEADIFKDGHDALEAVLLFKKKSDPHWSQARMHLMENDRWQGFFTPIENVRYLYTIEAWAIPDGPKIRYKKNLELMADRKAAEFGAWYEFFPRSQGQVPYQSATFKDCIPRLQDIKKMGFDTVYLPPIHPIGTTNRKGPDNVLTAQEKSPGSPWAIGNKEGGHKAVHPALGGFEEFKIFMNAAKELGLEIVLDLAFQCSPDHPYVKEHPSWFFHRPDGSIHYAENPPKKYEDIYPLNFYCEDWRDLWEELKSIVIFWVEKGINIFRVDNPHTKPLYFWKWLIDGIQDEYPQVIFLSEAFSRPKIMNFLGKAGFTQSYTYFTWRNTKWELQAYLQELMMADMRYYFRGNFFANTPDILSEYLQKGGSPAFKIRLVLASMLSSVYGIYSGFELCENQAKPNSEDYTNSEKYEIKIRDWKKPGNIKDFIAGINAIRKQNPALQEYKNLEFYETRHDQMLCFGKRTADNSNRIVVVVNLDPFAAHEDLVTLPLGKFGIEEWQTYRMHDLLTDVIYSWKGPSNYVRLDPQGSPAHIFLVKN